MTINQIHYFTILAKTENMRQASEILLVSQPSLTASLQKLEGELGVQLFDRIGHRIRLTAGGKEFLTHCERIEEELQNAQMHMEALSLQKKTVIRIGCVEPLLREYLPVRMHAFLEILGNTDLDFDVYEGTTPEMTLRLLEGKLDFFIGSETDAEPLEQKVLVRTPLVLISNKNEPGEPAEQFGNAAVFARSSRSWEELMKMPLLGFTEDSGMDQVLERMWLSRGISFRYKCRMPNETAIAALVENGFGAAILPWTAELRNFSVNVYPLPSGAYERKLCITTRKQRKLEGAAEKFAAFLISGCHSAPTAEERILLADNF